MMKVNKIVLAYSGGLDTSVIIKWLKEKYGAAKMFFKTIHTGAKNRFQVKKELLQIRRFQGVSGETTILPTGEAEKKLFAMKILKNKIVEDN